MLKKSKQDNYKKIIYIYTCIIIKEKNLKQEVGEIVANKIDKTDSKFPKRKP